MSEPSGSGIEGRSQGRPFLRCGKVGMQTAALGPIADETRLVDQGQFDKKIGRASAIPTGVAIPNRRKQAADATPQQHQNMRNFPDANPSAQSANVSKRTVRPIVNPCDPNAIKVLGMRPNTMAIATRIGAFAATLWIVLPSVIVASVSKKMYTRCLFAVILSQPR
jgi:hypothetical protein